jgi:hypothetical protein
VSRTTLIKFWIAAAILGVLLVGRHAHAGTSQAENEVQRPKATCAVVARDNAPNVRTQPGRIRDVVAVD